MLEDAEMVASTGDTIFVFEGDGTDAKQNEGINLQSGQSLIGEGFGLSVPPFGTIVAPGNRPQLSNAGAANPVIGLADTVVVRGLDAAASTATGIAGTNIAGPIEIELVQLDLVGAAPIGVHISNGTGQWTFTDVDIVGSAGIGVPFQVFGGDNTIDFNGGSISQGNNSTAIDIASGHNGVVGFGVGTAISATDGDGLQFDNADGTYDFDGAVTLNGGDAGIDILGGSDGTFTFSSATAITNPSGPAVNIDDFGAGGDFDFNGDVISNNSGFLFASNTAAGSAIHFNGTGANALTSTNNPNPAIQIFSADGDITFTTPTMVQGSTFSPLFATSGAGTWSFTDLTILGLKGLNAGIDVFANTGTVSFTNLQITTDTAGTGTGVAGFWAGANNIIEVLGTSMINADGGAAVSLTDIESVDMTFQTLSSTNNSNTQIGPTGSSGVSLQDVRGGSFDVVGVTTVSGAGSFGIGIEQTSAAVTFSQVDIDGVGLDGVIVGAALSSPGAVTIEGGTIANTIGNGAVAGSAATSATSLNIDNVSFTNIGVFTASFFNSGLSGSGNIAVPFSCNDGGGNTGMILFNGGADSCP